MNIKNGLCGIMVNIRENNPTPFDILGIYPDVYESTLKVRINDFNNSLQKTIYDQISKVFNVTYVGKGQDDKGVYYIFEVLKH